MSTHDRIRRQQVLREAEGYLELLSAAPERLAASSLVRHRLARRVLKTLERVEFTGPRKAQQLYLQGLALRAMDLFGQAIRPLEQSAEIDPENLHVWLALGWCYKRVGRLDLAIQSLEEAAEVDSDAAIVYYNLACYWSLASNVKHAVHYLRIAFDLDPNYRDLVDAEPDFDPIRRHPGFQAVREVIV
ncbi:MAG: tetratricopeptide repeat protein [Planctomycetes bacterium]|nr:tetratricopeptide repeat protein [Planctomycetota bacterium]